jgi:hypothetical protein
VSNTVAIGYNALTANTASGSGTVPNVAVGHQSQAAITTGTANVSLGAWSLDANTTGANNTAVGFNALTSHTGSNTTALGYNALAALTTGGSNTAVGYGVLDACTTGVENTCMGLNAATNLTTGGSITAIGERSGQNVTTAGQCTLVGSFAGAGVTTGGNNILIGREAGSSGTSVTTGSSNVFIGDRTNGNAAGVTNSIIVGTPGSVGKGNSAGYINPQGGGVYQGNNSSSWSTTSDRRIKKNIEDNNTGLAEIMQVQVKNFEYRTADEITELSGTCAIDKQGTQLGVIAQEIQTVLPDMVKTESTGCMSVDPDNMTWYLVNAVKELKHQLDEANARIATLESN